jgi:hypothetical protein
MSEKGEIHVDVSLYKKIGMTILTAEQAQERKVKTVTEKWPENRLFSPNGVSLEDAREAMKRCKR